jgi:hypothetical protein
VGNHSVLISGNCCVCTKTDSPSRNEFARAGSIGYARIDGKKRANKCLLLQEYGPFAFDIATGPLPGQYIAFINRDEATIEQISQTAEQNPQEAVKRFKTNQASSQSNSETIVVITEVPGQTISIESKYPINIRKDL